MEAFDIPALHALCIELSIPGPAAEACLAQAASAQAAPLLRHIPALLDASRAEAAMRELQAKCAPLVPMGCWSWPCCCPPHWRRANMAAGRSRRCLPAMGCFSGFSERDAPLDTLAVRPRLWSAALGRLLRLGTLEFEALPCPLSLS
ncbi:MAG: hypothetical protein ACLRI7_10675 [Ruthenibacterium lactatiformans]